MKQFQGTLVALVVLLVLVGGWYVTRPVELTPKERKALAARPEGEPLFVFEKADLQRVEVTRPDGVIVLQEHPDSWWIEGMDMRASRQAVNRVKHQLHDLVSRATVVEGSEDGALYGLGPSSIRVKLTMRDGSTLGFRVGDPNPSGVSYYVQRDGDDMIYTVKKSAMDHFSGSLSEFRERRFASFDSKDVDGLESRVASGEVLKLQRTGERAWELLEPVKMAASDMDVRSLLGRISAMKAIKFVEAPAPDATYGFDAPRASLTVRFSGGREPLTVELGNPSGESDGEYPLAFARIVGEPFVYQVRDVFLDDFKADPTTLRLTQFMRLEQNDLVQITSTYSPPDPDDSELAGTVVVKNAASEWQWEDGVIVPGSTPRRVAGRACDIESREYVAESGPDATYGFDKPVARVELLATEGRKATLLVGKQAPSAMSDEGVEQLQWYARHADHPDVYVVDDGILDVLRDLHREHGRHARGEAAEEERQARIDAERKLQREKERQERIEKRKAEGAKDKAP